MALRASCRLDEAIEAYRNAIRLRRADAFAHNSLANAFADKGLVDEAIVHYEQAIRLKGDHSSAHLNFAWLLATDPDYKRFDANRTVELAKRGVELSPKSGDNWNVLAAAHYRNGDWTSSIAALKKSMELRKGGDAFNWFFLAMNYWQVGEKEQARDWYRRPCSGWTRHSQAMMNSAASNGGRGPVEDRRRTETEAK